MGEVIRTCRITFYENDLACQLNYSVHFFIFRVLLIINTYISVGLHKYKNILIILNGAIGAMPLSELVIWH